MSTEHTAPGSSSILNNRMLCEHSIVMNKKIRPSDLILTVLIDLAAIFSILLLIAIMGYVFFRGLPQISLSFLTSVPSTIKETFGIAGNIVNTLYIIILTLLIAIPIGVGSAIYLNEYAKPGKIVRLIEFTTETLSGIPSIIFGLFGMVFFGTTLGLGYSILTGALTLTLMVLPLITRNTQEALKTVPATYRSGALGIGATKWYMIRTILLPSAMPGIITGIILAIGRIVGETAALIYTAGTVTGVAGLMDSGRTLAIHMYVLSNEGLHKNEANATAVVLLVIVLLINGVSSLIAKRFEAVKE